jgi:cell division transport system permease protein
MKDVFRRAFADFGRHRFLHGTCFITIALAVFIVSAFGLFLVNAKNLMDTWQQGMGMTAYLEPEVKEEQALVMADDIGKKAGIESVSFISRDEGLAWLKEQISDQTGLLEGLSENPLPDALDIRPSGEISGAGEIDKLADEISSMPGIAGVEYAGTWLHSFYGIYNMFKITAAVTASLVIVAIMFIGANTFRLILYSRQEEIEITRIIGAGDGFIKYPLYLESMALGFCGAIAGLGFLFLVYTLIMPGFSPAGLLPSFRIRFLPWTWIFMIIILSLFVGWLGCWFSVRRFLKF